MLLFIYSMKLSEKDKEDGFTADIVDDDKLVAVDGGYGYEGCDEVKYPNVVTIYEEKNEAYAYVASATPNENYEDDLRSALVEYQENLWGRKYADL